MAKNESTGNAEPELKVSKDFTEADAIKSIATTKQLLAAAPQCKIHLPKAQGKAPNYETVQVNGYNLQIMRGVEVVVPVPVRDIMREAGLI